MLFPHKLVTILNKDLEPGVAMNATAHMVLGLGAKIDADKLRLDTYLDKDNNKYSHISQMPFIILKAKSTEIRKTIHIARELQIQHSVFLNTMTGGTYLEQLEKTLITPEDDLIFFGAVLFGEWEPISTLTRKFSLYR